MTKDEELNKLRATIDHLRGFARDVMHGWPDCSGLDGCDIQDIAIKHGLLEEKSPRPTESCGEGCGCADAYSPNEFAAGITCYRKTPLLLGDPDE